ncbi:hypothetical protein Fmac_026888 [Flemingia macrophylla]|uniref:Uncharacterized protein n=1 Tax=Flemingia macrophylla TaxID=520843 RepID=A0ABD1LG53_9FABA
MGIVNFLDSSLTLHFRGPVLISSDKSSASKTALFNSMSSALDIIDLLLFCITEHEIKCEHVP